jgi:hypothetical protein
LAFKSAAAVVDTVVAALHRDWQRTTTDIRTISHDVCSSNFRGLQHKCPRSLFNAKWSLGGRLCRVQPDNSLEVHLSYNRPIPIPSLHHSPPQPHGLA